MMTDKQRNLIVNALSDNWIKYVNIQMSFRGLANDMMLMDIFSIQQKHEIASAWKMMDIGMETWLSVTSKVRDKLKDDVYDSDKVIANYE